MELPIHTNLPSHMNSPLHTNLSSHTNLPSHTSRPSLTAADLDAMLAVDIKTIDPDELRDIRDVEINTELPSKERMIDYISQIGNPYCYQHGKYVVKISFADIDITLEERMLSYIRTKC